MRRIELRAIFNTLKNVDMKCPILIEKSELKQAITRNIINMMPLIKEIEEAEKTAREQLSNKENNDRKEEYNKLRQALYNAQVMLQRATISKPKEPHTKLIEEFTNAEKLLNAFPADIAESFNKEEEEAQEVLNAYLEEDIKVKIIPFPRNLFYSILDQSEAVRYSAVDTITFELIIVRDKEEKK